MNKKIMLALITLAIVGLGDALIIAYRLQSPEVCTASFCGSVLYSQYATLLGISLAKWGIGFYGLLLLGILLHTVLKHNISRAIIMWLVAGGFLFSLYLFYIQIIKLSSLCPFCLISFGVVTVMGYLVFVFKGLERKIR